MMKSLLCAALFAAACSASSPSRHDLGVADLAANDLAMRDQSLAADGGHCGPLIPAAQLYEDVCPGNIGDRCFYTKPPTDGY